MSRMISDIRRNDEHPKASPAVRRRVNRRRRWTALRRTVPKAARIAAACIAVLSIGAGIALAASPAARQWAAGALYSRVIQQDGFFGEVRSSLTDGAVVGGKLLVAEDNDSISVYGGTDAEPAIYEWRDAGNRSIAALAADEGDIYALYAEYTGDPRKTFHPERLFRGCGLGRVTLGGDGTFDVAALAEVPATAILDPEGRPLNSCDIPGMVLSDGKLYFIAEYAVESEIEGFSFAPEHVRMFSWDPADGALSELDLAGIPLDWSPELFGGADGAYLAAYDDGAAIAQICHVEGTALSPVCSVPYSGIERPGSFALRAGDDLVYVLDGSVYVAPEFNPSGAVRIALCGDIGGRALMLDEATYAVVNGGSVEVFDLSAPLGEVDELVVDGDGVNPAVNGAFIAGHPDVAVVSDPGRTPDDIGSYDALMLAGRSSGDVVILDQDGFRRVRDAGLVAPLTDPELVDEWNLMPMGLRRFLSTAGRPAAIPGRFHAYADVVFPTATWQAVRGSFEDYPDTWLEYAKWLAEFSHSGAAEEYVMEFDGNGGTELDMPEQFRMSTLWRMAEAFARRWNAMDEEIDFARPEFAACVETLEGVDWHAMNYSERYAGEEERRAVMFTFKYTPDLQEDDRTAGARTLRIRDDAPRFSRASGYFAFVPAASTGKATAREYLKALVGVNHTSGESSPDVWMGYDFVTTPEVLTAQAGVGYTADAIRQYREQVGDVAFPAKSDREAMPAIRDAIAHYVGGRATSSEMAERLNALYE